MIGIVERKRDATRCFGKAAAASRANATHFTATSSAQDKRTCGPSPPIGPGGPEGPAEERATVMRGKRKRMEGREKKPQKDVDSEVSAGVGHGL